jgi:tRNA threonylcarbamoyladenosine biosynthesis protein TsaB
MRPVSAIDEAFNPPLLAIDTSSHQGAVALYDGQTLSFRSWAADRSHTTTLLAEIHHLLDAASVATTDLGTIGIAVGPGTFTGLRVGFGAAKGFHLATGVPLVGLSTLEATALPFAFAGGTIVATIGAGRGRLVWEHFRPDHDVVVQVRPPRNGTAVELAAELASGGPYIVAGELADDQAALLAAVEQVELPPRALRIRHPGAFAELLWRRWQARSFDDAVTLEPVYLSRNTPL